MEVLQAIATRRSVRRYASRSVDRETLEGLLRTAVQAPSAMNAQPWAFAVVTVRSLLESWSERAKAALLENIARTPWLEPLRERLEDPSFEIFYGAPALVVVYGRSDAAHGRGDACLAAMTLMLAATDLGLGTCWIGLSYGVFNDPEVKAALGVPEGYEAVAPITVGHPAGEPRPPERRDPVVFAWR